MSQSPEVPTLVTPFDELFHRAAQEADALFEVKSSLPDPTDTSPEAQHARLDLHIKTEAYNSWAQEGLIAVKAIDGVGDPERLIAQGNFANIVAATGYSADILDRFKEQYQVINDIRSVLRNSGVLAWLDERAVTLYPGVADEALHTKRIDNPYANGRRSINVTFKNGVRTSLLIGDKLPLYDVSREATNSVEVYSYGNMNRGREWLKERRENSGNPFMLGNRNEARLPDGIVLTDTQRYLFRLAASELKPKLEIAIPAPDSVEFRDEVTMRLAEAFLQIVAEPTEPHKTRTIVQAHGKRPFPRVITASEKQPKQHPDKIRDLKRKQLRTILEAADIDTQTIADATKEKVQQAYKDPTLAQILESQNAKRNIEEFLQAIFA